MNSTTAGYLIVMFLGVAVGMAIEEMILEPAREVDPALVQAPAAQPVPELDPAVRKKIDQALRNQGKRRGENLPKENRPAENPAAPPEVVAAAPKLLVAEPTYDFGQRESGEKVVHAFVLQNVGTAPLKIKKVIPIDGQTVAKELVWEIAAGEQAELKVTFDLARQKGRKIRQILVESNDPTTPVLRLALIGTAVSREDAAPER